MIQPLESHEELKGQKWLVMMSLQTNEEKAKKAHFKNKQNVDKRDKDKNVLLRQMSHVADREKKSQQEVDEATTAVSASKQQLSKKRKEETEEEEEECQTAKVRGVRTLPLQSGGRGFPAH